MDTVSWYYRKRKKRFDRYFLLILDIYRRMSIVTGLLNFYLASLDGVSMVVECLVQSKTNDRDQYNCGKQFLQVFASDEQRAQFIVACGGGYII